MSRSSRTPRTPPGSGRPAPRTRPYAHLVLVRLVQLVLLALLLVPGLAPVAGDEARAGDAGGFEPILIGEETLRFTGEPITLTLKDAEIKDVLRTFAEMTGLNIVVHPAVRGSVTVELHDVPWDQALDIILRINGLAWELEGNILYVAPPEHLVQPPLR